MAIIIKNIFLDIFILSCLKLNKMLSYLKNVKTAASVLREMNALGKLTPAQQKFFRQPRYNIPELMAEYKKMNGRQRLNMCMTMFPEAFKKTIGRGANQRKNPTYMGRYFTLEELENYLNKPDLPTVLQQVEGLEKGTANIAKTQNFTFKNPREDRSIRKNTAEYINNKFDKNPYCIVPVPENSVIDRNNKLLRGINCKRIDDIAYKVNVGGKPGKTYIQAPAKNCISDYEIEGLNSDFNKYFYNLAKNELESFNIPIENLVEASKFIESLGLDMNSKLTYGDVPLQRIFNAITSRHEVMEAMVNKRNVKNAPKGKFYTQGLLNDADLTSHNGPEIIADEIMNINSIFGHPANSDYFKLLRASESIDSPSYNALGYNYTDSSLPSIIANSRREAMAKARNYTNKKILPYTEIVSDDINDFINPQTSEYNNTKYILDPNINNAINNAYWTSHPSRINSMTDKGESFMRNIFKPYFK